MANDVVSYLLQYGTYVLEAFLLGFLIWRRNARRLAGLTFYVSLLLVADVVVRPYTLYAYGEHSLQYWYTYWFTDVFISLTAFLLVCSFFRRACCHEEKMWRFVRMLLVFVFMLVLVISAVSLSSNPSRLLTSFFAEVEQNLYFTCLVLNTLLYILMQQLANADEELGLLVCGVGIQFAGPAAGLALVHLTPLTHYSGSIMKMLLPLCTFLTLLIWSYALARARKARAVASAPVSDELVVAVSKA